MKTARLSLSLVVVALLLLCAAGAWARGTAGVANTLHNLSASAPIVGYTDYGSNESQICIFCHTPHGGSLDGPLWNRSLGVAADSFIFYNSATLSTEAKPSQVSDESLLCLACHDGSVSVYHLLNFSSIGVPENRFNLSSEVPIVDYSRAKIGATRSDPGATNNLTDDHPISFSYSAVYQSDKYSSNPANGLHDPDDAVALGYNGDNEGIRLFGSDKRVECSSCHDPHVDYRSAGNQEYAPFLYRPNTGSSMCLTCHNK